MGDTYRPPADAVRDIRAARLYGSTVLVGPDGEVAILLALDGKGGEWLVIDPEGRGSGEWADTAHVAAHAVTVLAVAKRVAPPADAKGPRRAGP